MHCMVVSGKKFVRERHRSKATAFNSDSRIIVFRWLGMFARPFGFCQLPNLHAHLCRNGSRRSWPSARVKSWTYKFHSLNFTVGSSTSSLRSDSACRYRMRNPDTFTISQNQRRLSEPRTYVICTSIFTLLSRYLESYCHELSGREVLSKHERIDYAKFIRASIDEPRHSRSRRVLCPPEFFFRRFISAFDNLFRVTERNCGKDTEHGRWFAHWWTSSREKRI